MRFSRFIMCFVLLTAGQGLFGQSQADKLYHYEQLDNREGLSNSFVNDVYLDRDNLLWIATWDGLNMYDGSSLHIFNYNEGDPLEGLGNNVIKEIEEDKQGNIWLGTVEGVSSYDKETGQFRNFFYSKKGDGAVSEQKPLLAVDTSGQVYCITKSAGLSRYNPVTQTFQSLDMPVKKGEVRKFIFDSQNRLWILHDHTLYVYKIDQEEFKQVATFEDPVGISNFFYTNSSIFLNGSDNGLYRIHAVDFSKTLVTTCKAAVSSLTFHNEKYFLTWADGGYSVFDGGFKPEKLAGEDLQALSAMKITAVATGQENLIWLGTDGSGIIKIVPQPQYFGGASGVLASDHGLVKQVRAFSEVNGDLWVGTKGDGIVVMHDFEAETGAYKSFTQYVAPSDLEHNVVYALKKFREQAILIAGDAEGIMLYDLAAGRFIKWKEIDGSESVPLFRYVFAILPDEDNSVWLGTSGDGLIQLKLDRAADGRWRVEFLNQYKSGGRNGGPINNTIYSLIKGNGGRIWVGCRYGGLSVFDKNTKRFRNISFSHENGLSNNDVLSLYKDRQSTVWIGTSYGLNWIQEDSISAVHPVFSKITSSEGLPNNTIHSVMGDDQGNIWVSTNNGLAMINPADSSVARYYASDGLQGNEFSDGAVWTNSDGYIFWGGVLGFNYVLPKDIPKDTWLPNLLLSNFQLASGNASENNFRVVYPGANKPVQYIMSPQQNFFEFNLKAISFLNAGKCEFAYFLEGHDKTWNYSGTSGRIVYSNIPPGNYLLKIRWSNGKGVWSDEVCLFNMTIRQYVWLSSWAFLIYAALLSLGLYMFYRYRNHKLEMKHKLQVEHLLRQKDEELYKERLDFFTNVTHELQTPLTLISGAAERCINQDSDLNKKPHYLRVIYQQAGRLTHLIHQLLEFRKAEAGYLAPRYEKMDISLFLTATTGLFTSWSDQKKIRLTHQVEAGMLAGMDRDKLEKITFNLLSNALKHSPDNANVLLNAGLSDQGKTLDMTVSNSGCSIPPEKLNHLFKKFAVLNESNPDRLSTGIGLAYVYELVRVLNGEITASAAKGWVTFRVTLPLIPDAELKESVSPVNGAFDGRSYLLGALDAIREPADVRHAEENNKLALLRELEGKHDRKKILLVEDEPQIRYLLRDILEDHYIVYEAGNGKMALSMLGKVMPDLIISDVMMPVMDGLEFCETIKNMQATCHIPVVMLSAKGAINQKTDGYEAGADAYIPKPFNTEFLLVRIRKLLEYREKMHHLFKQDGNGIPVFVGGPGGLAKEDKQFLDRISGIIQEHLDAPGLNSAFLEERLHLSKMQLYRRLKSMSGMTPAEFIKHIRIQHAAQMLRSSNMTVSEIIYQSGFANPSYFFREFKKRYNCSPGEFKARFHVQV